MEGSGVRGRVGRFIFLGKNWFFVRVAKKGGGGPVGKIDNRPPIVFEFFGLKWGMGGFGELQWRAGRQSWQRASAGGHCGRRGGGGRTC